MSDPVVQIIRGAASARRPLNRLVATVPGGVAELEHRRLDALGIAGRTQRARCPAGLPGAGLAHQGVPEPGWAGPVPSTA